MKRAAMTALLVDDENAIRAYESYHADVWPCVQADNKRCGAERIYIYRTGRRLFMFIEGGDDFDVDTFGACIAEGDARTQEWLTMMDEFLVADAANTAGMKWAVLKEVCALE